MYACVLAEIERMEMQAEGADGKDERIDVHRCEALTVVCGERVAKEVEVVGEFGGVGVAGKRCVLRELQVTIHDAGRVASETKREAGDGEASGFVGNFFRGAGTGTAQAHEVVAQALAKSGRDGGLML